MRSLLMVGLFAFATPAFAGPHCTDAPKASWLSEAEMKQQIEEQAYRIDVFKTTEGNCYEIYGRDADGKRVEIYFDPVTGAVVFSSSI